MTADAQGESLPLNPLPYFVPTSFVPLTDLTLHLSVRAIILVLRLPVILSVRPFELLRDRTILILLLAPLP